MIAYTCMLQERINTITQTSSGTIYGAFVSTVRIYDGRFETLVFPSTKNLSGELVPDYGTTLHYDLADHVLDAATNHSLAKGLFKDKVFCA